MQNVDLSIDKGEFLGVVGPNGGGKTTLLKLVLGLLEPSTGEVLVLGGCPTESRRSIGYVPQFTQFRRDFPITVEEAVLLGRLGVAPTLGGYRQRDREAARRAMTATEVLDFRSRPLSALSGGELQRVLIARALVSTLRFSSWTSLRPMSTSGSRSDIFKLLKDINRHATIVVVSHDIGFAPQYVTRVACLNRTLICHTTSEITGEMIAELYGRPMRMVRHASAEVGARP